MYKNNNIQSEDKYFNINTLIYPGARTIKERKIFNLSMSSLTQTKEILIDTIIIDKYNQILKYSVHQKDLSTIFER